MAPGDYVQWKEQRSGRITSESDDYVNVKSDRGRGRPNKVHKSQLVDDASGGTTTRQRLTVWGLVVAAAGLGLQALGVKVFSWLWDFLLQLF